jgi:hypothetical protein
MTPSEPFRVTYSGTVLDALKLLLSDAAAAGVLRRVSRALIEIEGRLELHPRTWGDPIRRVANANMTRFVRVHEELAIEYAVHDTEPLVWVTDVTPVLSHPLRKQVNE